MSAGEAGLALAQAASSTGAASFGIRKTVSKRDLDQRVNAESGSRAPICRPPRAELQAAQLDLDYTEIRAPVSGRVGKLEVTVGNLVDAGPSAPVLTRLVSVDPIYASFNADEAVVVRALKALADANAPAEIERIPVEMATATSNGTVYQGHMQLIDNQVDIEQRHRPRPRRLRQS